MNERLNEQEPKRESQEPREQPITYATPVQRIWAWVGVAYTLLLLLLTTYGLARGKFIRGIGGVMLSPALLGLGATAIVRYKQGVGWGGIVACILISGAAFALSLIYLVREVPIFLSQLGG